MNKKILVQDMNSRYKISEEDFTKTMMDYLMFKQGVDVKEFSDNLINKVLYSSSVRSNDEGIISISLESAGNDNE